MNVLGAGLSAAKHGEDALSVQEAELAMKRRLGTPEDDVLVTQSNLANSYEMLGRDEEALGIRQDVYSGRLKLDGEEHCHTLLAANNYAGSLIGLKRFEEAKALLRKMLPVARRVLGNNDQVTLMMRGCYAEALCRDPAATLDDLREAVETLEDLERIARRVLGGAHPLTMGIGRDLQKSRAALRAHETPPSSA
jgi:hypothetical protein